MSLGLILRHEVWRRNSNGEALRYLCMERGDPHGYYVLICDYFRDPYDRDGTFRQMQQADEVFFEHVKDLNASGDWAWHPTLQDAISHFESKFENDS